MERREVKESEEETTRPAMTAATARGGTSIAERRAAKFGFNAVMISTPRFRATSPSASPAARSPSLTLPDGISPSALLDSPIMLSNSQAMASPTTGSFSLPSMDHGRPSLNFTIGEDGDKGDNMESFFTFRPHEDVKSMPGWSSFGDLRTDVYNQALGLEQTSMDFEFPTDFTGDTIAKYCPADSSKSVKAMNNLTTDVNWSNMKISPEMPTDANFSNMKMSPEMPTDANCSNMNMSPEMASDQTSVSMEPIQIEENLAHPPEENQNEAYPSTGMVRTSEDGYNWRKYGQKHVKGSEYPRSYYKCTHQTCQVKKKVERSYDGQITEIIYKGSHNHAKPRPNRRSAHGSAFSFDEMSEIREGSATCVNAEGGSVWANQLGSTDIKPGSDGRFEGMEMTSSTSVVTDLTNPQSTIHGKSVGLIESAETPELSSTLASHDDDEDGATQGSMSIGDDVDDEESESKRRKTEIYLNETNSASRAIREPRVVVQIESEVDILDDGYRWRKYGQKVVKGNPNPRSYYKCTSAGCPVRKHVERASHSLKYVIITYEGKHNHDVPAARNSNQMSSSGNNVPPAAANSQPTLSLPRNINIPKPEIQMQDLAHQFDIKPNFSNQYLRPCIPRSFNHDFRFGANHLYQMKFPPLQSAMPPYAPSFGLNPNRIATQQISSVASVMPDFPMSLPLNLPSSGNVPLVGFDFNNGRSAAPVQPLLSEQQLQENGTRLLRPKQEQTDGNLYNASSSLASYNRIMGSFSP
ncbi:hypothetical protein UlMin_030195 [Ulmus minor]